MQAEDGFTFSSYLQRAEMYLSEDGDTVTVFTPAYRTDTKTLYTAMIGIDVSNADAIRETGRYYVSGNYVSSRAVGDDYLLFTNFNVRWGADYDNEEEYLPQTGAWPNLKSLPLSDIVFNEDAAYAQYAVVTRIGAQDFQTKGSYAFLSYAQEAYVSRENIFLTCSSWNTFKANGVSYSETRTTISCVSYAGQELKFTDDIEIAGTVLNRYCMDEYDGILRVAATVDRAYNYRSDQQGLLQTGTSASLYCIELSTFTLAGALEWFAPRGETVRSARFDQDSAYVCTAIQMTDPVFAIDLSDVKNITYKDTGTIPGYSVTLMPFSDDTLLGIGYGESNILLKIELYRETETSVTSVADYILEAGFSEKFKAHFIDRENRLIGLGVYEYDSIEPITSYLLLRYDGYELTEVFKIPFYGDLERMREAYADGTVYLFSGEDFSAVTL